MRMLVYQLRYHYPVSPSPWKAVPSLRLTIVICAVTKVFLWQWVSKLHSASFALEKASAIKELSDLAPCKCSTFGQFTYKVDVERTAIGTHHCDFQTRFLPLE